MHFARFELSLYLAKRCGHEPAPRLMPLGGIFFTYNYIIMDDEIKDNESIEELDGDAVLPEDGGAQAGGEGYKPVSRFDASAVHHLSGMYQNWFLDYASYVILERAVPHIEDGLKPVQRRILHSMKRMDDGRYNKVANIVGHTMQFNL